MFKFCHYSLFRSYKAGSGFGNKRTTGGGWGDTYNCGNGKGNGNSKETKYLLEKYKCYE